MPDVGTEEGEDPSWESGATTQIEVMSAFSSHTHTLSIDTVLRVSVKSQFPQGLADTFPGEGEESGERVKNEAKEESGGEESAEEAVDGNLEASTMTTTTSLPQAQKLQQPLTTSEPSKNKEQPALVGAATHAMFMSSETGGKVKDRPQNEVVSMKDKYAGTVPFSILPPSGIFLIASC